MPKAPTKKSVSYKGSHSFSLFLCFSSFVGNFEENFEDNSNTQNFPATTDADIDTPEPEITSLSDVNEPDFMNFMKRESLNDGSY